MGALCEGVKRGVVGSVTAACGNTADHDVVGFVSELLRGASCRGREGDKGAGEHVA